MTATKTKIEHFDYRDIVTVGADAPPEIATAISDYFNIFAKPRYRDGDKTNEVECIECGKPFSGLMSVFMGGGFTWGLVHGEGHCASCHWPARGHHFVKDKDGKELFTLRNFPLQYHPDQVTHK